MTTWFSVSYLFIVWMYINQVIFLLDNYTLTNWLFFFVLFILMFLASYCYLEGLKIIWGRGV